MKSIRFALAAAFGLVVSCLPLPGDDAPASLWSHDNLHAWCIVPFDALHRNSEDRAAMLERLGFKHFAYDWRDGDIPTFDAEIEALQRHHIDLLACWYPAQQQQLLDALKRHNIHTQLWVMCAGGGPSNPDGQDKAIQEQADRLRAIVDEATPLGCTVAIYPHDGWGGQPDNDIAILERLKKMGIAKVGYIYNFNHGQLDIANFPTVWKKLQPYVTVVNLNGMTEHGKRVLYLTQGDRELDMMRVIEQSGWRGPVGLISEQGDKDAEVVMRNNLRGLDWLAAELKQPGSGGPRPFQPQTGEASFVPALHDQQALDATVGGLSLPNRDELRKGPITVECWTRLHTANDFNILAASDTKASSQHWEFYTYQGSGVLSAYLPGMGGEYKSEKTICDEKWHYVAMILESNRVRLFVDGAMVKDAPVPAPTGSPVAGNIAIGQLVEGGHGCDGYIQDVRISKGARDVSKVPIIPLLRDADTLELWPLDGSSTPAPPGIMTDLPKYKTIPAAKREELTPANGWPPASIYKTWTRSYGSSTGNRYVTYDEINRQNVSKLTQAWIYHSGDGNANVQCSPIFLDGLLYCATSGNCMVALDAATGREVWRYKPEKQGNGLEDVPARRGLIYWPGDTDHPARIIFTMGTWIYALDPKTGQPVASFGQNGRTDLPPGGSSVPAVIYKNVLIYPGFSTGVFGYDVRTGAKLWNFNTLPRGREFGAATWDNDDQRDGANSWGGMALDEPRGIVYLALGSPKPNFLGMLHPGDNLYGNCLLALDAATGRRLWYFQEIRHDVWDLDISVPPNLVTVEHDGMKVDAVAQVTKSCNTLLLDRVTGKPLFPFRLRRAPAFKLEGDRGAVYQPDPELPEKMLRQELTLDDVTDRTPEAHAAVVDTLNHSTYGWYSPFEEGKPNAYFCLEGAEWSGASVDPAGRLYVCVSEIPWIITVSRVQDSGVPATPLAQEGEKVYLQNCAACHQANRGGNNFAPSLVGLETRLKDDDIRQILHKGRNAMPPQPQLTDDQINALCEYVLNRGAAKPGPLRWTTNGYPKLVDNQGYPGTKPPWGKLVCLDLNTGHIVWKTPIGEYPELTAQGVPKTGTQTNGGPTLTSTSLVFVSGTKDASIGAYDSDTGAQLWSHALPLHGTAPAIIYEVNGHEYVALAASGGGKLNGDVGDAWVAFALPEAVPQSNTPATPAPAAVPPTSSVKPTPEKD
jgi:quinoprotein glucose dehydrogenase